MDEKEKKLHLEKFKKRIIRPCYPSWGCWLRYLREGVNLKCTKFYQLLVRYMFVVLQKVVTNTRLSSNENSILWTSMFWWFPILYSFCIPGYVGGTLPSEYQTSRLVCLDCDILSWEMLMATTSEMKCLTGKIVKQKGSLN